jgi:hypothetical protein
MPGADLEWLQPKIRKGADVHEIHIGMAAYLFVSLYKSGTVLVRELLAGLLEYVRANREFISDVPISLGVFMRDCARSDHSDSQNRFS